MVHYYEKRQSHQGFDMRLPRGKKAKVTANVTAPPKVGKRQRGQSHAECSTKSLGSQPGDLQILESALLGVSRVNPMNQTYGVQEVDQLPSAGAPCFSKSPGATKECFLVGFYMFYIPKKPPKKTPLWHLWL